MQYNFKILNKYFFSLITEPHYCVHKIPRPDYILCWMNQEILTLHIKIIIALPSTLLFVMCSLPIII